MTKAFSALRSCGESESDFEKERDGHVKMMKRLLRTTAADAMFLAMFSLCLTLAQGSRCYAQAQAQPQSQTKLAKLDESGRPPSEGAAEAGSKSGELPA